VTGTWTAAPCSTAAAKYAVERWHYARRLPLDGRGRFVCYGLWEAETFAGTAVYSAGAAATLNAPYGLARYEVCELARLALVDGHSTPTTAFVAATLRLLAAGQPAMRLVVSFADPEQGHVGRIYQAGNWLYLGRSGASYEVFFEGRWRHSRDLQRPGKTFSGGPSRVTRLSDEAKAKLPRRPLRGKHRYVYPLDRQIRRRLLPRAEPYPAEA
jgi:hypothetical protein